MMNLHCVLLRCVLLPKYPHCTMHNRNDVFKRVFFLFMPSPLSVVVWCDGCIEFHLCYYHTVTALSMVVQVMGLISGVSCLILSPFIIVIGTSYFIDSNHEGIKTFGSSKYLQKCNRFFLSSDLCQRVGLALVLVSAWAITIVIDVNELHGFLIK
eukprot:scaffold4395_cov73-Skeletonema_marinoi.AAC.2